MVEDIVRAMQLWPIWLRLGFQDVRLRFRRSTLGVGWIFVNLAIMILAVGLIYSNLLGQELDKFLPFLTVGIIVWGYLTSSIVEGGNALIASEGYIRQIGLPIYIYIFRSFVSVSLTMLISLLAYFVVALVYRVEFGGGMLWVVPGLLLVGIASLLFITIFALLNARFRDAVYLATAILQVLFYVTPIIWPPESLRNRGMDWVIDCNPFYHLLEVMRQPLLHSLPATLIDYQAVGVMIAGLATLAWIIIRSYHRRIVYFL